MNWEGVVINFAHLALKKAFVSRRAKGFNGQDRKVLDMVVRDLENVAPTPVTQIPEPEQDAMVFEPVVLARKDPSTASESPTVEAKPPKKATARKKTSTNGRRKTTGKTTAKKPTTRTRKAAPKTTARKTKAKAAKPRTRKAA